MNGSHHRFTVEQVTRAIRAAFSPRWDTSLTPEEAVAHADNYRLVQGHYIRHIRRSLDEGDYLQVAEKSWGAFTQTVKAIGADHHIMLSSHVGIFRVTGELAALIAPNDPEAAESLNNAATLATGLHTHFYENHLPAAMVTQSAGAVSDAIDLLQEWFPPPANGAAGDTAGAADGL